MGASAPPMDDFTSPYTGLNLRDDGGGFAGTTSKPYPYVPSSKFPLTEAFFKLNERKPGPALVRSNQ